MSDLFSWTDLFVLGVGLEIAGTSLLVMGLILGTREIMVLSSSIFRANPHQIVSRVNDRVAASIGITWLAAGVVAQLVGYGVGLGISPSSSRGSLERGLIGPILIVIAAFDIVALTYRAIRSSWRRRLMLQVVCWYTEDGQKSPIPDGIFLLILGRAAGMPPREIEAGESLTDYARRVWHIREVTQPRDIPDGF